MKRILMLLATMLFAVLVVGGVAYALTAQCGGEPICAGTDDSDTITGTTDADEIHARGGSDRVSALGGNDLINGDDGNSDDGRDRISGDGGNDHVDGFGGNDVIHGGPDGDGGATEGDLNLEGAENSDAVYGGDGNDLIDAAAHDTLGSHDRSIGGAGNDTFWANDGNKDLINCGPGDDSVLSFDGQDVVMSNCEVGPG